MNATDPPTPPSEENPSQRTIRTCRDRAAAEEIVARLSREGIEASIMELESPPGRPPLTTSALRIVVDSDQAERATRLLQQHSPAVISKVRGPRKAGYRPLQMKSGTPWLFILVALLGAGAAIYYYIYGHAPGKPQGTVERKRERYVNEDLNHDGKVDWYRYLNAAGQLLREEIDLDGDGKSDMRMNYNAGRLTRRAVDLDRNGIMDQETYYDSKGRPFYSQVKLNGKGSVSKRTFYQEAWEFDDWEPTDLDPGPSEELDKIVGGNCWPFRELLDEDGDGNFDLDRQIDRKGKVTGERKLEKGAIENNPPKFPE